MQPEPPSRLGLRRQQRVTRNRDFMRVRAQGQRVVVGCLIANWQALPEGAGARLGVVTSKKIGDAVARSRARRLLRESYRQNQTVLSKPVELVLVARPSIATCDFTRVQSDFLTSLRRAGLLKQSNS